ncbi:Uncharacterised protein [uncultured archaeon]|nr:Uncharacterised protein [uncultured archaeon]
MKIQKQIAYNYKGKTRHKHLIVIPETLMEQLNWKAGDELETKTEGKELKLKKK